MGHTWAFSDLHGEYKLWKQIQNYMDKDDKAYFLGDAIDRGDDGMKILIEILCDKRITFILGNHEHMMYEEITKPRSDTFSDWLMNGGKKTKEDFFTYSKDVQNTILSCLAALPRYDTYVNKKGQEIFMCHAGTDWDKDETYWARNLRLQDAYLWNRDHFYGGWAGDENSYIVHGHTFTDYVAKKLWIKPNEPYKILKYADGHKIDLDIASAFSGSAALLNLDTFDVEYFYEERPKYYEA